MTVTVAPTQTHAAWLIRILRYAPLLVGSALTIAFLSLAIHGITSDVPTSNAEGNQFHGTLRVQSGQPLYLNFHQLPAIVTPYTPVFYLATGILSEALRLDLRDTLTLTRSVSFLATIFVTCSVYSLSRAHGAGRIAALTATSFFLPLPYLDRWSFTSRPDMLAMALNLTAAAIAWRRPTFAPLAAVVAVVAFFTKQTSIAPPIAITLWLWFSGWRRQSIAFVVIWFGMAGALVALLNAATSGNFLLNVFFAHLNPTNGFDAAARSFVDLPSNVWPFLILAAVTIIGQVRRGALGLISVYWIVALAVLFYTLRGRGAAENYFIESGALSCVLAAPSLQRLLCLGNVQSWKRVGVLLGAFAVAIVWGSQLWGYWRQGGELQLDRSVAVPEIGRAERIWSEEPSLTVFAGKPLLVSDPFLLSQMTEAGHYDVTLLVDRVRARYFDLIIVRGDVRQPRYLNGQIKWPELVLKAIAEFYQRNTTRGPYWLYVPDRQR